MKKELKFATSGDIHGFPHWEVLKNEVDNYDYIVFIGDYVDEYDLSDSKIYINLVNILNFKKDYPDKVVLLWGNHEIQYLFYNKSKYLCAGYRSSMFLQLFQLFTHNRKHFQLAFQIENYLWTHAGVSHGWYTNRLKKKHVKRNGRIDKNFLNIEPEDKNLADTLNRLFELNADAIHDISFLRGGRCHVGGPLWAHKTELYSKPLPGYHQIVGHTAVKDIKHYNHYKGTDTSTTFVDCLENIENIEEPFYKIKIEINEHKED